MIVGIGLDLCGIDRIERALKNPRFLQRLYTPRERARVEARGAQTAAGIFAAKEAVAKALGSGFSGFGMDAVEIAVDEMGKPACFLSGGAARRLEQLGGECVLVTITHEAGLAAAVAVIEGPGGA